MRIEILRQMTDDELQELESYAILYCRFHIDDNDILDKIEQVQKERKQPHDEVQFYE